MLWKTTMRPALARVLGIVGIIGAFGAGAAADHPYAAESVTGDKPYAIKGSPMGKIMLDATIDIVLDPATYYLVVDFGSAQLTQQIALTYTEVGADVPGDSGDPVGSPSNPPVPTRQPKVGTGLGFRFYTVTKSVQEDTTVTPNFDAVNGTIDPDGDATLTRAYRGDETDTSGVYKMELGNDGFAIDTHVRVELGTVAAGPAAKGHLAINSKAAAKYRASLYIYDELGDARAASRGAAPDNYLVAHSTDLFEVKSKIAKPKVEGHLATADVGYERPAQLDKNGNVLVSNGGPFRGFAPGGMTTKNVGVLATVTLNQVLDNPSTTKVDEGAFLNAADGLAHTGNPNTAATIAVAAKAGAFGFGNGAGTGRKGEVALKGDDPGTDKVEDSDHVYHKGGMPMAFRASTSPECSDNPLDLQVPGATAGSWVRINPNDPDNPTFSAQATRAINLVRSSGPFYLCVLVSENEVAIPAVGDDRDMDGYKITVTPWHGISKGPAVSDENGGSIDRNGTTVNITYLSVHPAYNQRLVIVNRGTREAEFWMDEFQTESGTTVTSELRGTVAAKSRKVIRVQDALAVNADGMSRASGTLNLTAPEADIDVMTLQVHPGTGQIDTTTY